MLPISSQERYQHRVTVERLYRVVSQQELALMSEHAL